MNIQFVLDIYASAASYSKLGSIPVSGQLSTYPSPNLTTVN